MLTQIAPRLKNASARLNKVAASRLFFPLSTLVVGALTYLYAAPWLGYFWDDWEVVFLLNSRNAQLFAEYFAFDRPFAWPYQLTYALVGLNPLAWHVATYLLRWGGIILLYFALREVWPRQDRYLRWAVLLLLVYPGFLQQSISGAYNRHFTAFFFFGLSMVLMVLSARPGRFAWLLAFLGWLTALLHIFTIEYFVGFELARPVLLWEIFRRRDSQSRIQAFRRASLAALPYLVILGFYVWWRLAVFPTTLSIANYAGDFKLLADFDVSPLTGVLAVLTRAALDLIYATLQVWLASLTDPEAWTLQARISWLALAMGAILALLFWRVDLRASEEDASTSKPSPSLLLFGAWAFVAAGLPIWLTSKQLSAQGRWDDRFALGLMVPACILVVWIVAAFIRPHLQRTVLAVLLALSISTQVLVVNRYRLDWAVQNQYYWQLHWRVPSLEKGTAIISFEQPSASTPGYDASFAMNVLFNGHGVDGNLPYWFFTNDRFTNFELRPDRVISFKDRNLMFRGNTSAAIALIHQGEARCLQVLDDVYGAQPFYGANQELLVGISNTSRILSGTKTEPPEHIFGPEPTRAWCYYFQKADLARQLGQWDAIVQLEREARASGYSSRFGPELLPFIEAHARNGDWRGALAISREAHATVSEMEPLLCATWSMLAQIAQADRSVILAAQDEFGCTAP